MVYKDLKVNKEEFAAKNMTLTEAIKNDFEAVSKHQDFYAYQNKEYKIIK